MNYITISQWDEALWRQAEPIFDEGFPPEGRKTSRMIRKIVDTHAGFLHLGTERNEAVAMAVTGKLPDLNALLIDYVAVRADARRQGFGRRMVECIEEEARAGRCRGIVIEIEADANEANERRERFWASLGFHSTDYVHKYRSVPEPYRAMYKELQSDYALPHNGGALFRSITSFHGKIWRN